RARAPPGRCGARRTPSPRRMPWRRPHRRERRSLPYFPGRDSTMLRKGGLMGRPFLAILALAVAPFIAGCVSGTTSNIDVNDGSTVIGTVRMSIDLGDRPGPRSHPHTSHAIELGLSGATGSDTMNLSAGQQPIVFGGETFLAPQEVRAEFDFRFAELAYRFRYLSENRGLGIETLVGLAQARLGMR